MLFGCYRRGDANDPETYVRAISAVLSTYDADLIREVTDPRTGIMTTEKHMTFMPNAGELKVYCDGQAARKERLKRLGERQIPDPTQARIEASVRSVNPLHPIAGIFVPPTHQRYARLCEMAKDGNPKFYRYGKSSDGRDGIWVAWHIYDDRDTLIATAGEIVSKRVIADILARKSQQAEAAE